MLFPDKFDEQLTRQVYKPRVFKFAADLAELYGRWVMSGRSFDVSHHEAINTALREHATDSEMFARVPLLALMQQDARASTFVTVAMGSHNTELDAANAVMKSMTETPVETYSIEGLV
jgi:hypothetical protein